MDDHMTARNALIAKSFCIEFRLRHVVVRKMLLVFHNGQWPANMEFVVKYKIAFPIAINTFVWHSAIEFLFFTSGIMYAEPRKNLVDTKQRTWQMHVECVRSCHKSRNIDDSNATTTLAEKSKQKCCLMSSKEVFEIVYEHRMVFSALALCIRTDDRSRKSTAVH